MKTLRAYSWEITHGALSAAAVMAVYVVTKVVA